VAEAATAAAAVAEATVGRLASQPTG
jgi:hypothetical protein